MKKIFILAGVMSCTMLFYSVQAQLVTIKHNTQECKAYYNYEEQIAKAPLNPHLPEYDAEKLMRENKRAELHNSCEASVLTS